jgi:hypothetical protein
VLANIDEEAITRCERRARGTVTLYTDVALPNGGPGAVETVYVTVPADEPEQSPDESQPAAAEDTPADRPSVVAKDGAPTGAPEAEQPAVGVVPDVVGLNHQLAQDAMQAAGFYNLSEEDATGQGRMLIYDRNWEVVEQVPAPGTEADPDTTIILRSKKIGE